MVPPELILIKHDAFGQEVIRYPGTPVYSDERAVVVRCRWTSDQSVDLGGLTIAPGDVFMEYYYPAKWYNWFAIYAPDGRLKGWYGNVTRPAEDEFAELSLAPAERMRALEALAEMREMARGPIRPVRRAFLPAADGLTGRRTVRMYGGHSCPPWPTG